MLARCRLNAARALAALLLALLASAQEPTARAAIQELAVRAAPQELAARASAQEPAARPAASHGALPWFAGSWEELAAKSAREERPVVVYLWTASCRWCRRLEAEALSDPALATALAGALLWNGDAEQGAGKALAERFGIASCPVVLFFDGGGRPRERLDHWRPKEEFLAEVARVQRDEGTLADLRRRLAASPDDVELRAGVCARLEALGDQAGRDAELAELRKRDPRRTSLPLRREVYAEKMALVREHFATTREINPGPLIRLLEEERHPELAFEGWTTLAALHIQRAEELERAQQLPAAKSKRADIRAALVKAAPSAPQDPVVRLEFAIRTVATFAEHASELSAADKLFLAPLAAGAVALDPEDARAHACVALAACLGGDKAAARVALRRAQELEPENPEWPALAERFGL